MVGETFPPPLSIACILRLFGDHACGLGRPGSVDVCRRVILTEQNNRCTIDILYDYSTYVDITIVIYVDICYIWGYVIIVIYVDICYICGYITIVDIYVYDVSLSL